MIIDMHAHPRFLEPQQGNIPSQQDTTKLDIIANPQQIGIAVSQSAHHYHQRNPVLLTLPEFVNQMN